MISPSAAYGQESKRYPLSFAQEWFLTMDKGDNGGPFGRRYLIVSALGVTGHVDLAVLHAALDDVVARHELLRTLGDQGRLGISALPAGIPAVPGAVAGLGSCHRSPARPGTWSCRS